MLRDALQGPLDYGNHVGSHWPHTLIMTSSTPTSKPEQQSPAKAVPGGRKPWWRRWLEPIVVVTIIIALFTALVTGGVAVFQSTKGDIRAAEIRVSERIDRVATRIDRVNEKIEASEARLHEEIRASEARQNKRTDEVKAEIKDVKAEIKDVRVEIKDLRTELKQDNAELKAEFKDDMRAMDNKLDQVLEALLPAKS